MAQPDLGLEIPPLGKSFRDKNFFKVKIYFGEGSFRK